MKEPRLTQMQRLLDTETVRVVFVQNDAYWVHNNAVYKAKIRNGVIDTENAVEIDVFALSDKEATVLLDILDSMKRD